MFQERTYRKSFNSSRFQSFNLQHLETDLWIGVDAESYHKGMEGLAMDKIKELRQKLDAYLQQEPLFAVSLKPFHPSDKAPPEARQMAQATNRAGVGPMASVAGLFSRLVGETLLQNFSIKELVIENGGDIFSMVEQKLVLTVFAGKSNLSEKVGIVIPGDYGKAGICTSAGTVGPSLSMGRADAVAVVCRDVLLADAFATALGNKIQSTSDIEKVLELSEKYPEIDSLVIICGEKLGVRGKLEIKIL